MRRVGTIAFLLLLMIDIFVVVVVERNMKNTSAAVFKLLWLFRIMSFLSTGQCPDICRSNGRSALDRDMKVLAPIV